MDAPYFKFYPSDWLSDSSVQFMSLEEEGAYIRLLCYAWNEGDNCGLPDDDKFISRLLKVSTRKWGKLKEILFLGNHAVFEKKSDGLMHNKRLDEEWSKFKKRRESAVVAANTRWQDESETDASALQPHPARIAETDSTHCEMDAILEVRSQKSESDLELDKRSKDNNNLALQFLAQKFPRGMSSKVMQDILDFMDEGLELELLNIAYRISDERKVTDKPSYIASILRNFLNDNIKTMAQYEATEAERQAAAGGARYEFTAHSKSSGGHPRVDTNSAASYAQSLLEQRRV